MKAPDTAAFARRLEAGADALAALVEDVGPEEARWHQAAGKWSINEIVGHLVYEECHDFRQRLQLLLEDPNRTWPPIDPDGHVRQGGFDARDLSDLVAEFLAERQTSVSWLEALETSNWEHSYPHPTAGVITAVGLLHCWAAHDLLHVRQIAAVRHARLAVMAGPYSLDYAGRL
jgi:hypothetical protein